MGNSQDPHPKRRWRWLALVLLLAVFTFGALHIRDRLSSPDSSSPLVGSWKLPNPQGPGTTRILTFAPNGRLTSTDVSDDSGRILQDVQATWQFDGKVLVFRERRPGIASLLDVIPGMQLEEKRMSIISVSDDTLTIGTPASPLIYTRTNEKRPAGGR